MRAAVFHDRGDIRIETVPDPAPGPGELVLEVTAVGVCGTDAKEYTTGPHMFPIHQRHPATGHVGPMIPGHEVTGRVVAMGDGVMGFDLGEQVATGGGASCGSCDWCRRGLTNLCERYETVGLQRHGGLAEFVAVPAASCLAIGHLDLTPDAGALAQPMAIATHVMRRGRLEAGDIAVVIGSGALGSLLTLAAVSHGATVVTGDIRPDRVAIAAAMGAHHAILVDHPGSIGEALSGTGLVPTVIYEASGTPLGFENAIGIAERGSRVVAAGLQGHDTSIDLLDLTLREVELIGTNSHIFGADFPHALELLASRPGGWRDVAPMVLPLDDLVEEALIPLAEGRSERIKTLIDPRATEPRPTVM